MFSTTLFSALLATTSLVLALPVENDFDSGVLEHVVFKRDALLDPRDLELAALHEVNTTEMFKHSVIKRSDGDDYTIWVHNSMVEAIPDKSDIKKRQHAKLAPGSDTHFRHANAGAVIDKCSTATWYDRTTASSPYTGGAHAIVRWAKEHPGTFEVPGGGRDDGRTLVIGGSNTGANMRFTIIRLKEDRWDKLYYGTDDIRYQTSEGIRRYQRNYGGSWRVAVYGGGQCQHTREWGWRLEDPWVNWELGNTHRSSNW